MLRTNDPVSILKLTFPPKNFYSQSLNDAGPLHLSTHQNHPEIDITLDLQKNRTSAYTSHLQRGQ